MANSSHFRKVPRSQYRLLGCIGQGQFGQVFCAMHRQTGDLVALKDIEQQRLSTQQFLRELRLLSSLQHPNIIAFHGLEHNPTGRYLVMDYCAGGTLRDLLEAEFNLSEVQRLQLIADVLRGLEHAHQREIIHCDLKPENILLTLQPGGWLAKVSDFGIARHRQDPSQTVMGLGGTGSPAYMAPERFYGEYSAASDLYAVGIMLFELLVGQRPFSGTPAELMAAHLNQTVEIPEKVPFILRSTITTALQKLPRRRFANAREMLQSLQLAVEVLEASRSSKALLSLPELTLPQSAPVILQQAHLALPVTHLEVSAEWLFRGTMTDLYCQRYASSDLTGAPLQERHLQLMGELVEVQVHSQGCLVVTRSPDSIPDFYSLCSVSKTYLSSSSSCAACISLQNESDLPSLAFSKEFRIAIASQGSWLALAQTDGLHLLRLSDLQPLHAPMRCPVPQQLLVLDQRYGLAVFRRSTSTNLDAVATKFIFFTRRSSLAGQIDWPITLTNLTIHPASAYRLFGIEVGESSLGVLLELKPLRIKRIALDIIPQMIKAAPWGYVLASRDGQIMLLDYEGYHLGQFELAMPSGYKLSAIAPFGTSGLLAATETKNQGLLYTLDLQPCLNRRRELE